MSYFGFLRPAIWAVVRPVLRAVLRPIVRPIQEGLSAARERAIVARQLLTFLRNLPALVLLRLEYLTGVSARAWRNALLSLLVGLIATVAAVVVLRRTE